jgi:L-ribulose-5-phosphate 3-epimerase
MTRRQLLGMLAACGISKRGFAAHIDRSWLSVITDEAARSPREAMEFAQRHGLRFVELRGVPGAKRHYAAMSEAELKEAAREFREHGIQVSFFNSGLLKTTLPGTEPVFRRPETPGARSKRIASHTALFDSRLSDLRTNVRAAQILGADKIRVFGFLRTKEPLALIPRVAEILGEMAEIARGEGVQLLVENETACNVATSAELAALMRLMPRSAGINWDPYNGKHFGENPFPDGYRLLPKDRIGNVQIKGKSVLFPDELMDWPTIFRTMAADGYRGKFGLETHIFDEHLIQHSHDAMAKLTAMVEPS